MSIFILCKTYMFLKSYRFIIYLYLKKKVLMPIASHYHYIFSNHSLAPLPHIFPTPTCIFLLKKIPKIVDLNGWVEKKKCYYIHKFRPILEWSPFFYSVSPPGKAVKLLRHRRKKIRNININHER